MAKAVKKKDPTPKPAVQKDPNIKGPISYLNSYYTSPQFKDRFGVLNQGPFLYDEAMRVAAQGRDNYNPVIQDEHSSGSHAVGPNYRMFPEGYSVSLDPTQSKTLKADLLSDILPHEYAHNTRALNFDEEREFASRHKNKRVYDLFNQSIDQRNTGKGNSYSNWLQNKGAAAHDLQPNENYSDLNSLRFMMYKQGIYDTRKGPMTIDHIQKAQQDPWLKNQFNFKRMMDNYSPEDIVELNNKVASTNQQDSTTAKNGKFMKIKPKYFDYESLPNANFGMVMDPGPRMPGLRIPGYSDPQPPLPQGPVPIGSIDTDKIQPGPFLDQSQLRPPRPELKKPGVNYGDAALLALTAFDTFLPNPVSRQQVVQPQMGYNANPYGTGSQALMAYGGTVPDPGPSYKFTPPKLASAADSAEYRRQYLLAMEYGPSDYMKYFMRHKGPLTKKEQINIYNEVQKAKSTPAPWDAPIQAPVQSMIPQQQNGGKLSPDKAKEMLKDGKANGKKLTKKQKQYFGMVAAGKAASGDVLSGDPTDPTLPTKGLGKGEKYFDINARKRRPGTIEQDALIADRVAQLVGQGYDPFQKEGTAITRELRQFGNDFAIQAGARIKSLQQDPTFAALSPEQRINRLYDTGGTGTTKFDDFLRRSKTIGGSPAAYYQGNPSARIAPTLTFEDGGVMYNDGGQIDTMWGGQANLESTNPFDGGMVEFTGNSHAQGGIGMQYNGNPVEVEGGEFASRDPEGNLNIYGNMLIPGSKTKFKKAAAAIAKKEKSYDRLTTLGSDLVNNANPANKWEQLKFNAGNVMMQGGTMGQKDLASKKEVLSSIQTAMLDMAAANGLDPFEMSKGKMKKAKKGASVPSYEDGGDPGDGNDPTRADRNRNPGNIKYGKFAQKYGARKDKDGFAIFPNINSGLQAMKDLLSSKSYKDMSVKDAISKWTAGQPYRYDLGDISSKKVSQLSPQEFETVIGTMRKGEGTIYGIAPKPSTRTPVDTPPFTPYDLPNIPIDPLAPPPTPGTVNPPYDELTVPTRPQIPSNVEPLHLNQILPELFSAATNRVEPVPTQRYEPQLYTPYQVSFQDRVNANQSTYNAQARAVGSGNPAALGTLGSQLYAANSNVMADEFRTNQSIANDITNKNIALVNDANLKNLGLADTQMVRQSQARSNTRAQNQMIVNSLSSKYAQNELENKRLAAYENLYDYRFVPQEDGGLSATYFGPNAMFNYDGRNTAQDAKDVRTISRYDANGNLKGYAEYEDSQLKEQQRLLDIEMKRRKLPLMPIQPLK